MEGTYAGVPIAGDATRRRSLILIPFFGRTVTSCIGTIS